MRSASLVAFVALIAAAARADPPRIDAVDPSEGPIAGGTVVTIRGANLAGAAVTIDDKTVTTTPASPTDLHVTTPKHDNGYALVKASTAEGSAYAEFLYVPPKLEDLPPGAITTIAGVGLYNRYYLPATTSSIGPFSISADPAGSIYVGSPGLNRVLRVRPDGILEPFAGNGTFDAGPNGDGGPATEAWVSFPRTCVVDAAGNAYIPDARNRIRRVSATTGVISTIAGTGEAGFSGDGGPATAARISNPSFVAVAPDGTLYFIDYNNARIRRVATNGTISTVAGNGTPGYSGDGGPATAAQIEKEHDDHAALALDPRGILYLAETLSRRVRRIDLNSGIISTFLPRPGDAPPVLPWGLAVDGSGNLFVGMEGRIVEYSAAGEVLAAWGDGDNVGYSEDGTPITEMQLVHPQAIALDPAGNPLFVDEAAQRVRRINLQSGLLETVAGIGPRVLGVPGPATGALLTGANGDMLFLPSGDLLLTAFGAPVIFRIDRRGEITTFSRNGPSGFGDSPGEGRPISTISVVPGAMAGDGLGGFYMCGEGPVEYVDPEGRTYHVAGVGDRGYAGDGGPAAEALLTQPWDVALDRDGNVFIADTNNNRIRRVDQATGIITTVAGGGGPVNGFEGYCQLASFCGDGGPALEACLNTPFGIAVDPDGNLFIGDTCNGRIRKVNTAGVITTFVDMTGIGSFDKLVPDAYGGLFAQVANQVRRFLADGSSWAIAGTGESGFAGDGGPAASAQMSGPAWSAGAIDIDDEGNLFFHDGLNHRFRAVRFGAVLAPPGGKASRTPGSQSVGLSRTSTPLAATVTTSDGRPAPNVRVDFTAPASAVSCVFAGGTRTASTLTGRDGLAKLPCTATCAPGTFKVTAAPLVASGRPAIGPVSFSITSSGTNPVPHIDVVSLASAGLAIELRGTGFSPCTVVRWNGADRPTTFVGTEELRATISPADLSVAGTAQITAATPAPGGGVSNSVSFPAATRRRAIRH